MIHVLDRLSDFLRECYFLDEYGADCYITNTEMDAIFDRFRTYLIVRSFTDEFTMVKIKKQTLQREYKTYIQFQIFFPDKERTVNISTDGKSIRVNVWNQ